MCIRNKTPSAIVKNYASNGISANSFDINTKYFIDQKNHYFYSNCYDINDTCSSTKIYTNKQKALKTNRKKNILKTIKVTKKFKNPEALNHVQKKNNKSNLKYVYFNKVQKSKISKSIKSNSCDSNFKYAKLQKNLIHILKNNCPNYNCNIHYKNNNKNSKINVNISNSMKKFQKKNNPYNLIKIINNKKNSNEKRNLRLYRKKNILNRKSKEKNPTKNDNIIINSINKKIKIKNKIIIQKKDQNLKNKDKMSSFEFGDSTSEIKTTDLKKCEINCVKINNYNVNKPKEINLKFKSIKNNINENIDDEMENISRTSKVVIGEIDGYSDIIEEDLKNNFRKACEENKNNTGQRSKSLNSNNHFYEGLNKICDFFDTRKMNYSNIEISLIDDQYETINKKSISFNGSSILFNNEQNKINIIYSNKKSKRKNYFIDKNDNEKIDKSYSKLMVKNIKPTNEKCFIY